MSDALAKSIDETREFLAEELPVFTREMVDTARAEGTTVAYAKVYEQMLKSVPGLAIAEKKDPYAGIPTINFTIGPGLQVTMTPAPAVEVPAPSNAVDVEAKVVPDKPAAAPELPAPGDDAIPADPLDLLTLDLADAIPVDD